MSSVVLNDPDDPRDTHARRRDEIITPRHFRRRFRRRLVSTDPYSCHRGRPRSPAPRLVPWIEDDSRTTSAEPLYAASVSTPSTQVAGILLSGGESRRMGRDKSLIIVDGVTLARRVADVLTRVVAMAIEVGPGHSGLATTRENPSGDGPLAAIAAGRRVLRAEGQAGAALVVACDLPFVDQAFLTYLVEYDAHGSVVPLVAGRAQPLLARWGPRDLDDAIERYRRGARSLHHLSEQPDVTLLDESDWRHVTADTTFYDVDTPDDLARYGLAP